MSPVVMIVEAWLLVDAGLVDAGLAVAGLVDAGLDGAVLVGAVVTDAGQAVLLVDVVVDAGLAGVGLVDVGVDGGAFVGAGIADARLPPWSPLSGPTARRAWLRLRRARVVREAEGCWAHLHLLQVRHAQGLR